MDIKNRSALFAAIQAKIGSRPCPLCGKLSGFGVEFPEYQILAYERDANTLNMRNDFGYIPCAIIICKNCGCIHHLSLQVLLDNPNYLSESH